MTTVTKVQAHLTVMTMTTQMTTATTTRTNQNQKNRVRVRVPSVRIPNPKQKCEDTLFFGWIVTRLCLQYCFSGERVKQNPKTNSCCTLNTMSTIPSRSVQPGFPLSTFSRHLHPSSLAVIFTQRARPV